MKRIVIDANILVRAVLGERVRALLKRYEDVAAFCCSDVCLEEARHYVPNLAVKHGLDPIVGLGILAEVSHIVQVVDRSLYEPQEAAAKSRIAHRDEADWPIVATSLLLDCPVWTEDQDFFGSGVATWTTRTVEVYLRDS